MTKPKTCHSSNREKTTNLHSEHQPPQKSVTPTPQYPFRGYMGVEGDRHTGDAHAHDRLIVTIKLSNNHENRRSYRTTH